MALLTFLRRELAPFPGRWRATLRIVAGCLAALLVDLLLGTTAVPRGHWTIITIFTVSQADAGASLRKSFQRILGTLVGGALGTLAIITLADLPMLYVPVLGALVAIGIFASLTTSAPYVMLLSTLTFVIVTFFPPDGAATAAETGLWRMLAVVIGVACGTGAQIFLWPDDPEERLRHALAARLAAVAHAMRALADGHAAGATAPRLAGEDLTVQLDLLANAEARHPSLRRRHAEQLALIVEIDRLLTTSAWLIGSAGSWRARDDRLDQHLHAIAHECSELSLALEAARVPAAPPPTERDAGFAGWTPGLRAELEDTWLALRRVRDALDFLDPGRPVDAPVIDRPERTPLLTPAFSLDNHEAIALALKSALGLVLCYVLLHALNWGALVTAGVTAIIVTQTSFGATVQKSALRLAGTVFGAALGIAVVVIAMPNLETAAGLLVVAGIGFGIAAWITAGSSRISYMGLQTGMAFAFAATDPAGPTTDLIPARDRVLGILVGVLAMLLVNATLWPVRARLTMWSALGRALRSIAGLARVAPATGQHGAPLDRAIRLRSAVYLDLSAALRLSTESAAELDARESEPERQMMSRVVGHAQSVFLSVLALIRHRLSPGFPALPAVIGTLRRDFASAIADILEALADGLGAGAPPIPDLPARLAALDAAIQSVDEEPALYDSSPAARVAERDHVAIARDLLQQVAALAEAVDAARALRAP